MALTPTTLKVAAAASLGFNLFGQTYALISTPSMSDIHAANLSFYSPLPALIAALFAPLQLLSLFYLLLLWRAPAGAARAQNPSAALLVAYAPFFAAANGALGAWAFFWSAGRLATAALFVAAGLAAHAAFLASVLRAFPLRWTHLRAARARPAIPVVHVLAKLGAALALLDVLHNGSAAFARGVQPGLAAKVGTGAVFAVAGAGADWILGGALVYDLVALAAGQSFYADERGWVLFLWILAAVEGALLAARNYVRKPYEDVEGEYAVVGGVDDEEEEG